MAQAPTHLIRTDQPTPVCKSHRAKDLTSNVDHVTCKRCLTTKQYAEAKEAALLTANKPALPTHCSKCGKELKRRAAKRAANYHGECGSCRDRAGSMCESICQRSQSANCSCTTCGGSLHGILA